MKHEQYADIRDKLELSIAEDAIEGGRKQKRRVQKRIAQRAFRARQEQSQ